MIRLGWVTATRYNLMYGIEVDTCRTLRRTKICMPSIRQSSTDSVTYKSFDGYRTHTGYQSAHMKKKKPQNVMLFHVFRK